MVDQRNVDIMHLVLADATLACSGLAQAARQGPQAQAACLLHLKDLKVAMRSSRWADVEKQIDAWSQLLEDASPLTWSMLLEWVADLNHVLGQVSRNGGTIGSAAMESWRARLDAQLDDTQVVAGGVPIDPAPSTAQPPTQAEPNLIASPVHWDIQEGLFLLRELRKDAATGLALPRISALEDWLIKTQHVPMRDLGPEFAQCGDCTVAREVAQRLIGATAVFSKYESLTATQFGGVVRLQLRKVDPADVSVLSELAKDLYGQVLESDGGWALQFPSDWHRVTVSPFDLHGDRYAVLSAQIDASASEEPGQLTLRAGDQNRALEVDGRYPPVSARLFWIPDWVERPTWLNAIALDDSEQTYLCVIPR